MTYALPDIDQDPKVDSEGSRRFIQGVVDKYSHTPTSRCYVAGEYYRQVRDGSKNGMLVSFEVMVKLIRG